MTLQSWRDRLVEELRRQGLPSKRVDRLVEELTDHASDMLLENPSIDAEENLESRLGTPVKLAAIAKDEFQRSTLAGRYPVLTFVVGPIVTVIVTGIGILLSMVLIGKAIAVANGGPTTGSLYHQFSASEAVSIHCLNLVVRFVPFMLSTWVFVFLGRRSGHGLWSIVACGIVATIAVFFRSIVNTDPATALTTPAWVLGFGWKIGLNQIIQAVVPLAFGSWMYWHSSTNRCNQLSVQ